MAVNLIHGQQQNLTAINDSDYTIVENRTNNSDLYEMYYSIYTGFDPSVHDIFLSKIQKQTAICGIVLTVLIIVINSAVIYNCVNDIILRTDPFYIQIINFSASHLTVSIFVLPFTVYYILYSWNLGSAMCKIWILFDIMIPFTSLIILLILNIDRILFMSHPNVHSCIFRKYLTPIMSTPWIISLVIVVPLWVSGTLPHDTRVGECIVIVTTETAMLCHILTFFIPLLALVIFSLDMLVLRIKFAFRVNRGSSAERLDLRNTSVNTVIEDETDDDKEIQVYVTSNKDKKTFPCSIASILMVNISFVAMWFPFQCLNFLLTTCESQLCVPSVELTQVVTWLGTASAAVTPLFWILDSKFRNGLRIKLSPNPQEPVRSGSISEETYL